MPHRPAVQRQINRYLLVTCSALLIFRSKVAERTLVHRDPWTIGLVVAFDAIVVLGVLAMGRDYLPLILVAVLIGIVVRALLIPRTPEQDRSS